MGRRFIASVLLAACSAMCCGQELSSESQTAEEAAGVAGVENASPFDGLVFYCTRCKKEVPEQVGAGANCPHCGAYFGSATNADGSETEANPPEGFSMRFWGPVILIVVFGGEYTYRRWKKRRLHSDEL